MGAETGGVVLLVRHTAVRGGAGRCYGRRDLALRDPSEVAGVARRWRGFRAEAVWSSPATRCLLLARAIGAQRGLRPLVDRRLSELDFGMWEGCAWETVPRPRLDAWSNAPLSRGAPGGESVAGMIGRVGGFARMLRARGGRQVVVSHGGPLLVLSHLLEGRRIALDASRIPCGEAVAIRL